MEKGNTILILLVMAGMGGIAYLLLRKSPAVAPATNAPPCALGGSYAGFGANATCSGLDYIEGKVKKSITDQIGYAKTGVKYIGKGLVAGGKGVATGAKFTAAEAKHYANPVNVVKDAYSGGKKLVSYFNPF